MSISVISGVYLLTFSVSICLTSDSIYVLLNDNITAERQRYFENVSHAVEWGIKKFVLSHRVELQPLATCTKRCYP